MEKFFLTASKNYPRVDKFLALQLPQFSRTKLQKFIKEGSLIYNGITLQDISAPVVEGITYCLHLKTTPPLNNLPINIPINVIYEDEDLIIVNKQANLVTHPGRGNIDNTLLNGLIYKYGVNNLSPHNFRPGIVHRLDKDTTGLIIIAKNEQSHALLTKMLKQRSIKREYLAVIHGTLNPTEGIISTFITKHARNRKIMCVSLLKGKKAITEYKTLMIFPNNVGSIVKCSLLTGRTHQIRVHLAYKKTPIMGDRTYTLRKYSTTNFIERQALHAYKIAFFHPLQNKYIEATAPLPDDIINLMDQLKISKDELVF